MNDTTRVETDIAKPADRPVRGFDVFLAVLVTIVANAALGIAIVFFVAVLHTDLRHPGPSLEFFATNFYAVVAVTTGVTAIILPFLWLVAKRFAARPWAYFFPKVPVRTLVQAVISALALTVAFVALELTLKYGLHISLDVAKSEEAMNPKSWSQLGIVLVCFAAFVPFYEEVLFRGFIFGWLRRVTPVWFAIVVSAAIFAAAHMLFYTRGGISGWVGTGEIFALGALMAWWAARMNSLRPAYAIHLVNNAIAFAMAFALPNWP